MALAGRTGTTRSTRRSRLHDPQKWNQDNKNLVLMTQTHNTEQHPDKTTAGERVLITGYACQGQSSGDIRKLNSEETDR
eukprot:scaffold11186_cov240-Skeletonema_menzelii.AAC.1